MKLKTLLLLPTLLLGLTQCSKENENNTDLTTDIVGTYYNPGDNFTSPTTIVVTKVNNQTVSINVNHEIDFGNYSDEVLFSSTTMNSNTQFTVNTVFDTTTHYEPTYGYYRYRYSANGKGTLSGNTISIPVKIDGINITSNNVVVSDDYVFTGIYQ